jgi:hypothetical protein
MRVMLSSVTVAALIGAGPLSTDASATTPRNDTNYQVVCTTPEGDLVEAETVDAHSIQFEKEPGGKDGAVLRFVENHPGWDCWLVGPSNG